MQWRSCAQRSLRPAAAGLEGSDAHPRQFECRRHTAIALARCPQQFAARSAARSHREPDKDALSNPADPARRRARGPVGQPPPFPPTGSSVPRGNQRRCAPWQLRRSPPVRAQTNRVLLAGSAGPASAIAIRTDRDAKATRRGASAVGRSHAKGVRRPDSLVRRHASI